jgi:hypothetical protein
MPPLPLGVVWAATCFTSLLLLVAGTIKIARPHAAAGSLRRSSARLMALPQQSIHRVVRVVGAIECGAATMALFAVGWLSTVVSGVVFALFGAFVVLTNSARRRGHACGCWGSLSDGPAGVHEVRNRVCFAMIALVPFAGHLAAAPRRLPFAGGLAVVIVGAVVGGLMSRNLLPTAIRRLASLVTVGVSKGIAVAAREASRRERRDVLAVLRADAGVHRVEERVSAEPRLAWRRARVRSPRDAAPNSRNYLVSVPGDGVNLRVVVNHGRPMMVIGESDHEVVTFSASRLVVAPKPPTPLRMGAVPATT